MHPHLSAAALVLLAIAACSAPSPAPTATVLTAAPDTLHPRDDARNDLTLTIAYTDGDGDLGRGRARIHDCRSADLVTDLALPAIASDDAVAAGIAITGELTLLVNDIGDVTTPAASTACTDLGAPALAPGQAAFCVLLVDQAGHTGDGDCTAALAIAP